MARRRMLWGGIIAASVAVASVAITTAVGAATSPERPVREYLAALAADDLTTAAVLAGLDADDLKRLGGMPVGDAGEPDVIEIVDTVETAPDQRVVRARYGERGVDVAEVAFSLEPAAFGPFRRWVIAEPPVARLGVAADRHDEIVINGARRTAEGPGRSVAVAGFIPSRVEAAIASPYLEAAPVRTRLSTASASQALVLGVTPSPRLSRLVDREVATYLEECVSQPVLQPAGCPFGIAVPDRVLDEPQWRVSVPAVTAVVPGPRAGAWALEGGATVRVRLTVQRLIDGVVEERDEAVVALIRGRLTLGDDAVTVTFASPED